MPTASCASQGRRPDRGRPSARADHTDVGLWPASRADPLGDYLAALDRTIELAPARASRARGADRGSGRACAGARGAPSAAARRRRPRARRRAADRLPVVVRTLRGRLGLPDAASRSPRRSRTTSASSTTARLAATRPTGSYLYRRLIIVGDDSRRVPAPPTGREHFSPHRRRVPARAGERGLRGSRVRPRHRVGDRA